MPRSTEGSQVGIPLPPDTQAWRHYGDGFAGLINTSRIQGFYASAGDYRDVAVSSTGELLATLDASGVTIGTVAQGAAGASAWPVSLASLPSLAAGSAVIGHVIVDTAPTTAVTQSTSPWVTNDPGLPDTLGQKAMTGSTGVVIASDQASIPVAATLAAETSKVIGTINQGGTWTVQPGNTPNTTPWLTSLHDGTTKAKIAPASTLPVASDTAQIVTVRDALTIGADTSGLAKDATITAAIGTAGATPSAYTVLDQLTKIRQATEAALKTQQQLVAFQTPALPRKTQATLLHRS